MTIPNWGRITPSQGFMLMLAGHVLHRHLVPQGTVESDDDRKQSMRDGKASLCSLTGRDFGFDLKRWHDFLQGQKEWGYCHPYAWKNVRIAIEKALHDPDRLRLVQAVVGEERVGGDEDRSSGSRP